MTTAYAAYADALKAAIKAADDAAYAAYADARAAAQEAAKEQA